jgi:hypothetical protein
VYRRRDRKQRNQRVAAAVVGLVLAGIVGGVLARSFLPHEPVPADEPTPTPPAVSGWPARSVNNGTGKMNFSGGLSQHQACIDTGTCNDNVKLRPKASWRDLWDEINCTYDGGGSCPTADGLRWTTQMTWKQTP